MSDIDFFFDPVCPWAWITSRWVEEVYAQRPLAVEWRLISLRIVNRDRDYEREFPPGYEESHQLGLRLLRIAAAAREAAGNEAVGRLYSAAGAVIHVERQRRSLQSADGIHRLLDVSGLAPDLAAAADDESLDRVVEAETSVALERAGTEVGTPVITFGPPDGPSFFGPVTSQIPRGEEALRVWDLVVELVNVPGFAELKRSRERPQTS